jgi:hypothetical protein
VIGACRRASCDKARFHYISVSRACCSAPRRHSNAVRAMIYRCSRSHASRNAIEAETTRGSASIPLVAASKPPTRGANDATLCRSGDEHPGASERDKHRLLRCMGGGPDEGWLAANSVFDERSPRFTQREILEAKRRERLQPDSKDQPTAHHKRMILHS